MKYVHTKITDQDGNVQEVTGDMILTLSVKDQNCTVIAHGEYDMQNFSNLMQGTMKAWVQMSRAKEYPSCIFDMLLQE
ncbi:MULTISPECIES: hypothetical protein [Bacillus]|uniref:hypothetical protein n=1 Tax=Bacillus TaxID=1386 RepID=UPI0001A19858|nr:hypothetical protein [Bacillus pseudomycoides]EEM13750.1 hypothetical protein bpmyx0001_53690 [Bacillus pseudomycoides DSM 12442]MED1594195.1 hypothetical protein [Bacillus pseudomycoides]MED4714693.1 hypothetical protein [Bacillus pseudomycoides]OOR49494.1 hypothetical protein BLX05_23845 [Bacillus pseudomycoides]PDY14085.1 hypothetical protein COO16_04395 [Bacillus pseudomycoides]